MHQRGQQSGDRLSFQWRLPRRSVGGLSVAVVQWSAAACLAATPAEHFNLLIPLDGQGRVQMGDHAFALHPELRAALASPGAPLEVRPDPGLLLLNIGIASDQFAALLSRLTPVEPDERLSFEPLLDLRAEGPSCVCQLARLLQGEAEREPRSPALIQCLCEALLTALLTRLPHTWRALVERPPRRIVPGYLRRAEDYMLAKLAEPLTMGEVAEAAGVSVRTLQTAFQEYRQCSPLTFLQEKRLQEARRLLLSGGAGRNVAGVARFTGFRHLGRFSLRYRARFGESPSATLARFEEGR